MGKLSFNSGGQWQLLQKSAAPKLSAPSAIPEGVHEVEVHPDVDHLKRVKGLIGEVGSDKLKIGHLKQMGIQDNVLKKLPRDSHGWVSQDMIDKHIDSLPKHKVMVYVGKYDMNAQMHEPNAKEHVLSVSLHPDTYNKMTDKQKLIFDTLSMNQHHLSDDINSVGNKQMGWARVDASAKPDHWHVDEIQSDFVNHDKIKQKAFDANEHWRNMGQDEALMDPNHPMHGHLKQLDELGEKFRNLGPNEKVSPETELAYDNLSDELDQYIHGEYAKKHGPSDKDIADMHDILSHGHDDPQHLIHSVVNELARKHNIKSMSMDTPEDQITQSGLANPDVAKAWKSINKDKLKRLFLSAHFETPDSWSEKGGTMHEGLDEIMKEANIKDPSVAKQLRGLLEHHAINQPDTSQKYHFMIEKDPEGGHEAFEDFVNWLVNNNVNAIDANMNDQANKEVPLHHKRTYRDRPKKLGYKTVPKNKVLDRSHGNEDEEVQHTPVYKSREEFAEELAKTIKQAIDKRRK